MTLKVFLSPTRDEQGKFRGVVQAFPDIWRGLVLDVGCRSGNLKHALPSGAVYYYGLDLFPPADVLGNLGTGLPFKNVSFDTVVALDVLEHTDDIHRAFSELCRIARKYVLIILPNVYDLKLRICVLMGWKFLDRHGLPLYGLPVEPPKDRHRWFFSLQEARSFTHTLGQRHLFHVQEEGCLISSRRRLAVGPVLVSLFPNLLSPSYVALLSRKESR